MNMSIQDGAEEVLVNVALIGDSVTFLEVAVEAIRNSAYWYGHPHGPARAPRHADRIVDGRHGWEIEFGANTFLVGLAISRCMARIEEAANVAAEIGSPVNERDLRGCLELDVRGAVANFDGNEYLGLYDAGDGFMHFGTQAIHVASFVATVCDRAQIYLIAE